MLGYPQPFSKCRKPSAPTVYYVARFDPNLAQILPFATGAHPAMGGAFTILRFAEPDVADVVYIEQLTRALYLDKSAEVDSYLEIMSQLCLRAESAADTTKLLQQILSDI